MQKSGVFHRKFQRAFLTVGLRRISAFQHGIISASTSTSRRVEKGRKGGLFAVRVGSSQRGGCGVLLIVCHRKALLIYV